MYGNIVTNKILYKIDCDNDDYLENFQIMAWSKCRKHLFTLYAHTVISIITSKVIFTPARATSRRHRHVNNNHKIKCWYRQNLSYRTVSIKQNKKYLPHKIHDRRTLQYIISWLFNEIIIFDTKPLFCICHRQFNQIKLINQTRTPHRIKNTTKYV